jgi:hypothetical protein
MMRVYLDNCCFNRPFDDKVLQKAKSIKNIEIVDPIQFIKIIGE